MRGVRRCPTSLAVGFAVLAGALQASAQDRPKVELGPQVPHLIKTIAAFSFAPFDSGNWQPDIFGVNGIHRFRQKNGSCQITFAQNRGANAGRAAGGGPQKALDNYIAGIAANIGKLTRNKTPALELSRWVAGGKVTFLSEEIAYTGKDNVAYHMRISSQWMGDVEFLIIAACPSAEWNRSQGLLNAFLSNVSIAEVPE